jgi:hypothetical protein
MAFPILKYLALNPASNKLNISNATQIDRDTIYESIGILTTANLIYVVSKRNPIVMEYAVTPRGVVALLQATPDYVKLTRGDMAKLAENHTSFLPLIFGKWKYLPEELACTLLLDAVTETANEVDLLREISEGKEVTLDLRERDEVLHRHRIYQFMLHTAWYGWLSDEKSSAQWFWAIRGDDQLLEAAKAEIARIRLRAQEEVQLLDDALQLLQSEEDNDKNELPRLRKGFKSVICQFRGEKAHKLGVWLDFERALALDEGRALPTPSELIKKAFELSTRSEELRDEMLREGRSAKETDEAVEKLRKEMRQSFYEREEKQGA